MEIRALDKTDDGQLRAAYDVNRRAELIGREDVPFWSFDEYVGAVRSPDSRERAEMFGGYLDGQLVGTATLYSFLLDNVEKAWADVDVDPDRRRRGHGRELLGHVEDLARKDDRTLVMTASHLPIEEVETHGYRRFLEACGYALSNIEVVRYLRLPVDATVLQGWADGAADRSAGYEVQTFVDDVPEDLVPSLCVLFGQLAVDAPTGAVDFEEETMTPEHFAERRDAVRAMGRTIYETVAITPDRVVVAQTTLSVPTDGSTDVYQWGTFVHREHRGRRLGMAVKAANLRAVQEAYPQMRRVHTQNAETNDFMVSINVTMGFDPVEASAEFVKRF